MMSQTKFYFDYLTKLSLPKHRSGTFLYMGSLCSFCNERTFNEIFPIDPRDLFGTQIIILICNECMCHSKHNLIAYREKYFLTKQITDTHKEVSNTNREEVSNTNREEVSNTNKEEVSNTNREEVSNTNKEEVSEIFRGFVIDAKDMSSLFPNLIIKRSSGILEHGWKILSVIYNIYKSDYEITIISNHSDKVKCVLLKLMLIWNNLTEIDFLNTDISNSYWNMIISR